METLLREGVGRVGEAETHKPQMPSTVAELEAMSWTDMKLVFALTHARAIRAVVDQSDAALRIELER